MTNVAPNNSEAGGRDEEILQPSHVGNAQCGDGLLGIGNAGEPALGPSATPGATLVSVADCAGDLVGGDRVVATSGLAPDSAVVAISGYKSASQLNAKDASDSQSNPQIFPVVAAGSLFGIAKSGITWRKPRRKTKPGNPKVAADGYEWRKASTGDGFVLWRSAYLQDGTRGNRKYAGWYERDTVKQLEKDYGKREIPKTKRPTGPRRLDSGRGSNSDSGAQAAGNG